MSDIASKQVQIREHLITALHTDLIGPMRRDEVLASPPSRWYLTGFLVPTGAPPEQRTDPLADEQLEEDARETHEGDTDDDVRAVRTFLPSSMGLSFQVPADAERIQVTCRWGDYVELDEAETRLLYVNERQRQHRARGKEGRATDELEGELRFRYWKRALAFSRVVPVPLDGAQGTVLIPDADGVYLRWLARPVPGTGLRAVSLFLVNGREPLDKSDTRADQRSLFQAEVELHCQAGFVARKREHTSDDPDERRNDLQFRDHAEWAVGHGIATEAVVEHGACHTLRTTWTPRASVFRMKAVTVKGAELRMEVLEKLPDVGALRDAMTPLFREYTDWIDRHADDVDNLSPSRQVTAGELLEEARLALGRMQDGLRVLDEDEQAFDAFRIANGAMAAAARQQRPDSEPEWRLFQLAFVLASLTGIAEPGHPDRERVDLLFFPTGGGKTEAYLGVAAFALALRRLRGQGTAHHGAGVAVILRYTLRLLTLDQLRRAAQLVCALELTRRERPDELGPHRFSIGLWVGRSATANRFADVKKPLREYKDDSRRYRAASPIPLESCPWCGEKLTPESFELAPDFRNPRALIIGCMNLDCPFGFGEAEDQPAHRDGLPLVVIDEQVYWELPSIIVGTVDKFASLPWRGQVGMLFGRVQGLGEYGYIGEHESASRDVPPLSDGLPPPELIIQDELHLISGPLGTMVGLYETAIDAICRNRTGFGPKIVASTATARRATHQIQALFGRPHVHLFPPQGPDDGDTFFAEVDDSPEKTRVYLGVAAPGRSAKVLAARTYTALLGAAQRHWEQAPAGRDNPGDTYMTLAAYFNALKELGGAQRLVQEDVAQRTEQLPERRPIDEEQSKLFASRRVNFDILELTSRQTTDKISAAIERLNLPYRTAKGTITDVLLASSMISVGVDISRLGLMVVNGQPRTTAEYIQASSRVGRSTPGLVVTALNLYKPRDRSHYERFTAYHQSFYREVEAASVTPFSTRAVDRGLAGLVVGLVRHLGPQMAPSDAVTRVARADFDTFEEHVIDLLIARAQAHKDGVPAHLTGQLADQVRSLVKDWRLLIERVHEAAGTLKYSPWELPKNYQALLSTAVDDLTGANAELLARFQAPTSMRDVEPSVHVWVDLPKIKATP